LNYNVQEPTSYSGRNFIELKLDKSYFQIDTDKMTAVDRSILSSHSIMTSNIQLEAIISAMKSGFHVPAEFSFMTVAFSVLAKTLSIKQAYHTSNSY
jgi:hypothetical protein